MVELYLHSPIYLFMAWCLSTYMDNFTVTLVWMYWNSQGTNLWEPKNEPNRMEMYLVLQKPTHVQGIM
jgi:hypothetical protein